MKPRLLYASEKPTLDQLVERIELWATWRDIQKEKGNDIAVLVHEWTEDFKKTLESPSPLMEFEELCDAGCLPIALTTLLRLFEMAPSLERAWVNVVGSPTYQKKARKTLEAAARELEVLYGDPLPNEKQLQTQFSAVGRIPVSKLIAELRLHVRILKVAETVKKETKLKTLDQLARYLITSYVARMTGSFHDRPVAALIGSATGSPEYTEVAQRMWRDRNYSRLESHFSWMAKFAVAMSVAISQSA